MVDADMTNVESSESEEEQILEKVDFVQIARELAANTIKEREIAFKKLHRKLFEREGVLDRVDGLRIWKGLFFMLWHSDGLEVQEKLCERFASVLSRFSNPKNRWTFLQTGIEIFNREWLGIDRLRMSKFMLVCRLLLRTSFELLGRGDWEEHQIQWFLGVMGVGPLQYHQPVGKSASPLGLRYHFADIWTEELIRVGGSNSSVETPLTESQTFHFLACWCKVATLTGIGAYRNKIRSMIFDDIIERSEVSLTVLRQHAETDQTLAERVAEMEDAGFLKIDFGKLADFIIQLTEDENVKMKQRKSMNRIVKKFKSLAQGELPLDDISDWTIENDEVDKFLFHTDGGYSKKELKKWDGLKNVRTLSADMTGKLEAFVGSDLAGDSRVQPVVQKKSEKRKSKKQKIRERAQRKRKLMNEILDEKMNTEPNNNEELTAKKVRKNRKAATKQIALSILSEESEISEPDSAQIPTEEIVEIKPRQEEPATTKLAELAERIRLNIDTEAETAAKPASNKKSKKLKGEDFQFVKLRQDPSEPKGTAFVSHAQRKMMKKQKKQKVVSKAAVEIFKKESKLKFNENLVQIKPFKKLDKPEVVGTHQGELNIHNPDVTPRRSALKNKAAPRKIVGNKGKLKWQG